MNGTFFSTTYNRALGTLALVALVAALASYAYFTLKQAEYLYTGPTTISISGEGEVFAKPDIGQFSFAVTAKGADATAAQTESATKINAILDYLKEQGVEEKDIKTENYNLYPHYRYEERACAFGQYCPPGEQVLDGYEVSQSVIVKVRDLEKAGTLITGVGERGATNAGSLTFTIDDEDVLKAEARSLAIVDANVKAEKLAKELGVRIVRMTGYYEEEGGYPMPYGRGGDMMESAVAMDAVAPSLPVGENTVRSRVSLTFQVQ